MDRDNPLLDSAPYLHRIEGAPPLRFGSEIIQTFYPAGWLEGFELILPAPFLTLPTSRIELRVDLRVDGVPSELDRVYARFRLPQPSAYANRR